MKNTVNSLTVSLNSFKIIVFSIFFTVFTFMLSSPVYGQDNFEGILYNFVEENGNSSLQPYADALSSNMNSGLFHTAKVRKGFSMYFGLKAAGTYINPENTAVKEANKTLGILPVAVPQISMGALFGTEISARFLPSVSLGGYGSVGTWGIGIKHGITSHFKKSPVDVAIGFSINKMTIGDSRDRDMVQASATAVNLQVSKQLSVFTFYTGVQYENTSVDVNVKYEGNTAKMSYENQNKTRGIVGLNIKLGPLNLNGDYSIGKTNAVTAGFGFAF